MRDIGEILDYDIYPRIQRRADLHFPEFGFTEKGENWEASRGELRGENAGGHVYYYEDRPFCFVNHKNGETVNLRVYIQERDRISDKWEAVKRLADMAGYTLPEPVRSPEAIAVFEKKQKRADILGDASSYFRELLFTEQGAETLSYLRGRGYEDSEIQNMHLGHFPGREKTLAYLTGKGYAEEDVTDVLKYLSLSDYRVTIPYPDRNGRVAGIYGRLTRSKSDGEAKYMPLSEVEGVRDVPFLLSRSSRVKTLVLVEGYFDALAPTVRNIPGVVAVGSASLTRAQLETLKREGVKSLVLAFDGDEAGTEGMEKAIPLVLSEGFVPYVVEFTEEEHDPDNFLRVHGTERFRELLEGKTDGAKWLTERTLRKHDITGDEGKRNALEEVKTFEETVRDPIARDGIRKLLQTALGYDEKALEMFFGSYREQKTREREEQSLRDVLRTATRMLEDEALTIDRLEAARKTLERGLVRARGESLRAIVAPHPLENIRKDLEGRSSGLQTSYSDLDKFVTIRPALTLIAGRPSHGKTAFMLNLMRNMVHRYREKAFVFFSYEEDKTTLAVKYLALQSRAILSPEQNTREIERYIRTGGSPKTDEELLVSGALAEYQTLADERRLWIVDEPLTVESLVHTLEYLNSEHALGAVFVDYIQRVKYGGQAQDERIKIARISEALRETATRLSLPIICGAQFNRDQTGRPRLEGLKESGHLEEDANTVLGIFNLRTARSKEKWEGETGNGKPPELKNCKGEPANTENPRSIDFEVHVLKNRGGGINESVLLTFDAPTLRIASYTNV